MSPSDCFDFDLTSELDRLAVIREQLGAWLPPRGWSDSQTGEIVLAVDEALANVIRHGYDLQPHNRIVLNVRCIAEPDKGDGVEIEIRDFGKQIEPDDICGRNLDAPRPGGLGVHIIRATMNTVTYTRAEGGGMRVIMRKFKTHTAHPDAGQAGTP